MTVANLRKLANHVGVKTDGEKVDLAKRVYEAAMTMESTDDDPNPKEVSSMDAPTTTDTPSDTTQPAQARTGIGSVCGSKNSDLKPEKFSNETTSKSFKS